MIRFDATFKYSLIKIDVKCETI